MHLVTTRLLVIAALILACTAPAQNLFQHMFTSTVEDMAEIKRKAEAGDRGAQYKLANSLASQFRAKDAFQWYAKAARQGDLESFYQTGRMLLYGASGSSQDQTVQANPAEGIQIVFRSATNGHHGAAYDIYRSYKEGRGVSKDMVQAYAWLQLHVDGSSSLLPAPTRFELNQLALQVDVPTSQEGKRLAALYRSGRWPVLVVQPNPEPAPAATAKPQPVAETRPPVNIPPKLPVTLKLNGIALGQNPLAIINGKSLAVGETATIPAKPQNVTLKCIRIEKDTVMVSLEGETEPRAIRLTQ